MAFLTAGVVTSLAKTIRRLVRPFFLPGAAFAQAKPFYDFAGWLLVQSSINYIVSAFILLNFMDCLKAWHRMGWYGHILIVLGVVGMRFGGKGLLISLNKKAGNDHGKGKKVRKGGKEEI